jgi:hypothetical protein
MRPRSLALLLGLRVAACGGTPTDDPRPEAEAPRGPAWPEVVRLTAARDYFTLRDRLAADARQATPPARFARAVVEHAFDDPAASNPTAAALLAERS